MPEPGEYGRREVDVSIIVRAHGAPELTAACLKSIADCTDVDRVHVILIDQEEALQRWCYGRDERHEWPPHTRVVTHANVGAVRATNLGLGIAMLDTSDYILVLDNDTEVPDGDRRWLDRWLAAFGKPEDRIGAVGATSDYVSGPQNIQWTSKTYTKDVEKTDGGEPGFKGPLEVPWLISFACMYRKAALQTALPPDLDMNQIRSRTQGGSLPLELTPAERQRAFLWDERFDPGNSEDIDICFRMAPIGWKFVVARDIYIRHRGSQAFRADGEEAFRKLLEENAHRLLAKWGAEHLVNTGIMQG